MAPTTDGMAPVKVPANLPELVRSAFNRARASGDVHFFPTEVTLVNVHSVPFQLRFSPALAEKPRAPQPPAPSITTPTADGPTTKGDSRFFDPFDDPPPAMLITPLPPSHNLVLNKFAIVPEHFILATKAFKPQNHLLEPADLAAAYACIEAYHYHHQQRQHHQHRQSSTNPTTDPKQEDEAKEAQEQPDPDEGELFVFFNSGPHSGASQPHRHIQLLPVARMREGLARHEAAAWDVLARRLGRTSSSTSSSSSSSSGSRVRASLPFQTFAEPISPGADLPAVYARLYRRACEAVLGTGEAAGVSTVVGDGEGHEDVEGGGGAEGVGEGVEARVDYNLAMTREVMVIAPRVAEGEVVWAAAAGGEGGGQRTPVGRLALNGTVLAGTALVKSRAEWDALRAEPEQLLEVLGRIGVPTVHAPSLV
ncbi:90a2fc61-dd08-4724-83cd-0ab5f10154e7 [Thermothielavioides terrestris]|uniref:90a2fc61-dd08-4724-83cd-0ab5f10154e7 n=1 Tax=Thermothielavioides terrestris TaxID=2587410 RepID=A0A3S4APR6_9PEZI|nr:90a2fc61-dd08-4724-83cd-0ab5f10154e7 [Thermothielavioides terrestris]